MIMASVLYAILVYEKFDRNTVHTERRKNLYVEVQGSAVVMPLSVVGRVCECLSQDR